MAWAKDPKARKRQEAGLAKGRKVRAANVAARKQAAAQPTPKRVKRVATTGRPPVRATGKNGSRAPAGKDRGTGKAPARRSPPVKDQPTTGLESGGLFRGLFDQFF